MSKITQKLNIIPLIILTEIFRIGSFAIVYSHLLFFLQSDLLGYLFDVVTYVPPLVTVLFIRRFSSLLQQLSVSDCLMGLCSNVMRPTEWGKLNTYQSRWLQFGVNLYFSILYCSYLVWAMVSPPRPDIDMYACIIFCSGWISFPLYVGQLFSIGETEDCLNQENEEMEVNHESTVAEGNQNSKETMDVFIMGDILWNLSLI